MPAFTVSSAFAILVILAITTTSSVAQAGDKKEIHYRHFRNGASRSTQITGKASESNICTGDIQVSCNQFLKTNNTEVEVTLSKNINEYFCVKGGRRVVNEDSGTFSKCVASRDTVCKEFCSRCGISKYDCNEYDVNQYDCICGKI